MYAVTCFTQMAFQKFDENKFIAKVSLVWLKVFFCFTMLTVVVMPQYK